MIYLLICIVSRLRLKNISDGHRDHKIKWENYEFRIVIETGAKYIGYGVSDRGFIKYYRALEIIMPK